MRTLPLPCAVVLASLAAALLSCSAAAQTPAQAPGFDCSKAHTQREKTICASPDLSAADARLAAAYKSLMAAAPPAIQAEFRAGQNRWLRATNAKCTADLNAADYHDCLLNAEKSQTDALNGMVAHKGGITFFWRTVYLSAPDDPDTAANDKERNAPDYGYLNVSWPEAQSAAPEWVAWNKVIAARAHDTAAGASNAGNENATPPAGWDKQWASDNDIDVTVELNAVSEKLVTASVATSDYEHGAAHPNHGTYQFNWLLKEQREIKPADVFKASIYWSKEVYDRTDKYLHGKLDEDGKSYQDWMGDGQVKKTLEGIVTDPHHWQIDKDGLTIVFSPYEVAPYCCTPEPFTMKWESLKPMLNPAFPVPVQ